MKKTIFTFFILLFSCQAFAAAKVIAPVSAQPDYLTSQAVGGVGPTGEIVPLSVDASGNLQTSVSAGVAWSVSKSSALEASHVIKASSGSLRGATIRIDSTAPSASYYIQFLNASSLPANGAVTHLIAPLKRIHANGTDDYFSVDFTESGLTASTGIVIVLSTTEFTKTISGAYLSMTVQYK